MNSYRNMNRQDLDAAYDNSRAVADSARLVEDWQTRSAECRARYPAHLDLAYGKGVGQRIDYFSAGRGGPVLVFIHGGYWQMRAREDFSFVAEGALAHGIDVAMIGYTLAPEASVDQIVGEIRSAIGWLANALVDRADGIGGDPSRIVVSGWSAGGHLATMALNEAAVTAGLAISGIFDLEPIRRCYLNDKLRLTEAMAKANSPILFAHRDDKALIVACGGDELPELQRQSLDYANARRAAGGAVDVLVLDGRHHFSVLESLANPDGQLLQAARTLCMANQVDRRAGRSRPD